MLGVGRQPRVKRCAIAVAQAAAVDARRPKRSFRFNAFR